MTSLFSSLLTFMKSTYFRTRQLATWIGNRYSAYTYLHINILQIKQTINTLFPSLQITRLFYVKTAIK
ncbi:hypothetical protein DW030_19650 [Parabacteroides merdae]|nr:hypothetical protein DW030_19650 [Parabacteroides merdae]